MIPTLNGIDHIHVHVSNWNDAEQWYSTVLGFKRVEKYAQWAVDNGPLTLENPEGNVHLALFESNKPPSSTIAFGATGEQFLAWKEHLERHHVDVRISDHELAWSLYFNDPFENAHEITTYDHAVVTAGLPDNER